MSLDIYQHCCKDMQTHIESGELHIQYIPKFREYGIDYGDGGSSIQVIQYCPWCGKKLPMSRRLDWFEQLDLLGLDPEDELPSSLKGDEWWRLLEGKGIS